MWMLLSSVQRKKRGFDGGACTWTTGCNSAWMWLPLFFLHLTFSSSRCRSRFLPVEREIFQPVACFGWGWSGPGSEKAQNIHIWHHCIKPLKKEIMQFKVDVLSFNPPPPPYLSDRLANSHVVLSKMSLQTWLSSVTVTQIWTHTHSLSPTSWAWIFMSRVSELLKGLKGANKGGAICIVVYEWIG